MGNVRKVVQRLEKTSKSGDGWRARCPAHDDSNPSLSVAEGHDGTVLLYCHAGCTFEEIRDALGVDIESSRDGGPGYTLIDYADKKSLPAADLRRWGVRTRKRADGPPVVQIPYRDGNGDTVGMKVRSGDTFWWEDHCDVPYGVDKLVNVNGDTPVILVEGESDCHASWAHGVMAIGVPGSESWRGEWADYFDGKRVFVWEEPDEAGEKFAKTVSSDIPGAKIISSHEGVKDLADLHQKHPDSFRARLNDLIKQESKDPNVEDRSAPQAKYSEKAVLAATLMDSEAQEKVMESLGREDFYERRHRVLFGVMMDLYRNSQRIDVTTVADKLREEGNMHIVGGMEYLANLRDHAHDAHNVKQHCENLQKARKRRELIDTAERIKLSAEEGKHPVEDMLDWAEAEIFDVSADVDRGSVVSASDLIWDTFELIEERVENEGEITGLETGFTSIDRHIGGLSGGEFIVLAGRPSMGKSALMTNVLANAAIENEVPVLIFSMEMSRQSIMERLLSAEAHVDLMDLKTGNIEDHEYKNLSEAAGKIKQAPIYVDETPALTPLDIRSRTRRAVKEHGVEIVGIDYMQLMEISGVQGGRTQEVTKISRQLKGLAKELDIPVVALSQLNRGVEHRDEKRPQLSDLRESGAIEQDADVVGFLFRPEYYMERGDEGWMDAKNKAELLIRKQRNGPTGTIRLRFIPELTKFEDPKN